VAELVYYVLCKVMGELTRWLLCGDRTKSY